MSQQNSFHRDYKSHNGENAGTAKKFKLHWLLVAIGALSVPAALGLMSNNAEAMRGLQAETPASLPSSVDDSPRVTVPLALPPSSSETPDVHVEGQQTAGLHTVTIKSGDTLSSIFDSLHLSPQQLHEVLSLGKNAKNSLTRLVPGQTLQVKIDAENLLEQLTYKVDERTSLVVSRENGTLNASEIARTYETRVTFAKASIETSLFEAAQEAGLSDRLTMEMAGIFGWDIDFALDIRKGDNFVVMYEELYLDGKKVKDGNILAAEFNNQGNRFRALRFTDASGTSDYYTPEGKSMRKAFLRTPVDFTRISSRFGTRYHPVLNRMRSHKGVDYAAPRGTPVRASGDGKIIHRGLKGGYGKTIVIQHGNQYSTLYAHLSTYARKARAGSHVRQGQIIGYVGSSGLATGPHLHYEFRVHGAHRNPLTVRLPMAAPIDRRYKPDFEAAAHTLLSQLDIIGNPTTAFSSL